MYGYWLLQVLLEYFNYSESAPDIAFAEAGCLVIRIQLFKLS
jgi:hypothetical protein